MATTDSTQQGPGPAIGRRRLVQQLMGFHACAVMHALVALDVPDHLAKGPAPVEQLAAALDVDTAALRRLLRAGVLLGLVHHDETGAAHLTDDGELLCTDTPGSIRNLVVLWGGEGGWRSWGELARSVRTGRTAYDHVMGEPLFDRLDAHPDERLMFNEAMAESTRVAAGGIVATLDLAGAATVVDVGGGNGTLLAALLHANPGVRGVLFDRERGVAEAREVLDAAGVGERVDVIGGDFFEDVPARPMSAYVLKSVLHDWDDERCRRILRNIRDTMTEQSVLHVVEPVVPGTDPGLARSAMTIISDLNMLVCTGGAERTEAELRSLLESSGFALVEVTPCPQPSNLSVLRAVPVG
jgi:hypothetical protein